MSPGASGAARDELVAGRAHRNTRTRVAENLGDVEAREHAEVRRREQRSGVEHTLPDFEISTRMPHVIAVLRGLENVDGGFARARALHHHDGVGALGHRRTGHDPDRFPGTHHRGRCHTRRAARRRRAARPAPRPTHRRCRTRAPRTRPSRCSRTAVPTPPPPRLPRARGPRASCQRNEPRRQGCDRVEDALLRLAQRNHERTRLRDASPLHDLAQRIGKLAARDPRGRARARCWHADNRAFGRRRSGRPRNAVRAPSLHEEAAQSRR